VVGFVLVVAAVGFGVRTLRPHASLTVASAAEASASNKAKAPRSTGLRGRMEERLRRRFDES
jgi:hypothetical protein